MGLSVGFPFHPHISISAQWKRIRCFPVPRMCPHDFLVQISSLDFVPQVLQSEQAPSEARALHKHPFPCQLASWFLLIRLFCYPCQMWTSISGIFSLGAEFTAHNKDQLLQLSFFPLFFSVGCKRREALMWQAAK